MDSHLSAEQYESVLTETLMRSETWSSEEEEEEEEAEEEEEEDVYMCVCLYMCVCVW